MQLLLPAYPTAHSQQTPAQQGMTTSSTRVAPTLTTATALPGRLPVHPEPPSSSPTAASPAARLCAHWAHGVLAAQQPRYRQCRPAVGWAARPAPPAPSATRPRCLRPTTAPLATITPTEAARRQVAVANATGACLAAAHAKHPFPSPQTQRYTRACAQWVFPSGDCFPPVHPVPSRHFLSDQGQHCLPALRRGWLLRRGGSELRLRLQAVPARHLVEHRRPQQQ